MAWRISWHLSCDRCKTKATFAGQPSRVVVKKARDRKWEVTADHMHYCPECAKKRAEEAKGSVDNAE